MIGSITNMNCIHEMDAKVWTDMETSIYMHSDVCVYTINVFWLGKIVRV